MYSTNSTSSNAARLSHQSSPNSAGSPHACTWARLGKSRALERVEGLLEGGDEVFGVLDATRDAHEAIGDAHLSVVRVTMRVRVRVKGWVARY